jgi:hypothetical protein
MAGPYVIQTPVQGQPISSSLYGQAVKDAIADLHLRSLAIETIGAQARGELYVGQRGSSRATANDNIEVPVIRLDNCLLRAGRNHEIRASGLRVNGGGTTPHFLTTIRYSTSGAATIASTEVARSEGTQINDNLPDMVAPIQITGVVDVNASFLLGFRRTAGTAAVTLLFDNVGSIMIKVIDTGPVITETGIDL